MCSPVNIQDSTLFPSSHLHPFIKGFPFLKSSLTSSAAFALCGRKPIFPFFSIAGSRPMSLNVIYPALKVFTGKGFAWCFNRCYRGGQKSEVRN